MSDEKVDLGAFGELVGASEAIPHGEVWMGPRDSDPFAMFGPGTTKGGRAEAGWLEVGTLADDGLKFGDPCRNPGLT